MIDRTQLQQQLSRLVDVSRPCPKQVQDEVLEYVEGLISKAVSQARISASAEAMHEIERSEDAQALDKARERQRLMVDRFRSLMCGTAAGIIELMPIRPQPDAEQQPVRITLGLDATGAAAASTSIGSLLALFAGAGQDEMVDKHQWIESSGLSIPDSESRVLGKWANLSMAYPATRKSATMISIILLPSKAEG